MPETTGRARRGTAQWAWRCGCLPILAGLLAPACCAQAQKAHRQILPVPREISYGTRHLDLHGIQIRINSGMNSGAEDADQFAAQTLHDCIGPSINVQIADARIATGDQGHAKAILLYRTGASDPLPAPGEVVGSGSREAYQVRIGPEGAEIRARSSAGIYYGVQTVCQMIEGASLPETTVSDWPRFAYRGTMVDISEGQILRVGEIERQIDLMARLKMNQFYLYNELSIALDGLPPAAPGARMSKDDVRRIVTYARRRHIDVVPCLELYGHLHDLFRREEYSALADFPHGVEFNPENPEVQALLRRWADEYMEMFPGPFVHVGFDETWQLRQAATHKAGSPEQYFLEQLRNVSQLFMARGKTVMAWGDMMVKYPEIIPQLPRGTIAIAWCYDSHPDPEYKKWIEPLSNHGQPLFVAPGIHGWVEIAPDYALTFDNIDTILAAGAHKGALGVMNTVWSDDVQMLKRAVLPGIAYGAIAAWQQTPVNRERFFADYTSLLYPPPAQQKLADALQQLAISETALQQVLGQETMNVLWQNPFRPKWLNAARAQARSLIECRLAAERAERELVAATAHGIAEEDVAAWLVEARLLDYAGMKFQYAVEITDAWNALGSKPDPDRLENDFDNIVVSQQHGKIPDLMEAITELKPQYEKAWLAEFTTYRMAAALGRWDAEYEFWRRLQNHLYLVIDEYNASRGLPAFETVLPAN